MRQRKQLSEALEKFEMFTVFPSEANFLLVKTAPDQANSIHAQLKEESVLVKNLNGSHPLLVDCLRINVSSSDENTILIEKLTKILG